MNPFLFRGHSYKYEEFRNKGIFLDCEYHDDKNTYKAHKIVLSIFSTLLHDYFIKNPSRDTKNSQFFQLPIPYNASKDVKFNDLVDFFYSNRLVIDKIESTKLLPWLSMGYIYDAKSICEIIEPIIKERFLAEPKDDDLEIILSFSEYYKKVQLSSSIIKQFDNIEENLRKFLKSQQLFVSYLEKQFEYIETDRKKLSKLTPFLLSEILKSKNNYDDIKKARILENYVKILALSKEEPTIKDKKILQSVINWDQDDAYKLFTYNNLDWVLPDVQRPQIIKLLRARRKTLQTLENEPVLKKTKPINHWYAISSVNEVETAHEGEIQHYSITHFIGTLGNSNKVTYINPKLYNFLETDFSDTMSESMHYDEEVVFNEGEIDEKSHYLSECVDLTDDPPPYAGFKLPHTTMNIAQVVLHSCCKVESKKPKHMKLILDDLEISTSSINGDQIVFNLNPPKKAKSIKLQVEVDASNYKSFYFALRVHRLEVFGNFLSS